MAQVILENQDDVKYSKVKTSRTLFYITIFGFITFVASCSYGLFTHRYKGKPKVEVPESTQYNPKYK